MDNLFATTMTDSIKTIRPGDKMYRFQNGFMLSDRASIEISPKCPPNIANFIAQAYQNGWIKPVAHCTEKEYMLLGLGHGDL
jgi:hypothetical protein